MSLSIGIIGLPNVGKSTLFNALLKRQVALAANYPFATIEPNVGVVDVPDKRLDRLAEIVRIDLGNKIGNRDLPEKITPTYIKFYDIAGLVKGASQGEGLGNAFLSHIREVDALLQVVRDFDDENVVRAGSTDPGNDIEVINTELILADIQVMEKRIERMEKDIRGDKTEDLEKKLKISKDLLQFLSGGALASEMSLDEKDKNLIADLNLLTMKPMMYVYNIDESKLDQSMPQNEQQPRSSRVYISAKIESEIGSLDSLEEKSEFMSSLNIREDGLDQVISQGYDLLGLQTYLTMGPKEVRAWTIAKGTFAPQAAGKIHTDFERGFISAEIVGFNELDQLGSLKRAKEKGLVRLEGKNYVMKDGDVVEFRFNV